VGGAAAAPDQGDQLEHEQGDQDPQHDPAQDPSSTAAAALGDGGIDSGGDASHGGSVPSAEAAETRQRATWIAAAVLAVIVAVLAIVLFTRGQSTKARQDEVKAKAEKFALALSTYDYRHLNTDLGKVRSMGVGNFRYQYEDVLGANSFSKALSDNQAIATAKVKSGPFVAALTKDDARTFTVVSQTIKGKSDPQGETRNVRVESILVRTPKGWQVDWVQIS
jgi:preprotein translocase subunit SecG